MSSQQRTLFDIPSMPESILRQKYAMTNKRHEDPNAVMNFMKETLRDTGSEKPFLESDLPRRGRNPMSEAMLNMREGGSRYTHDPNHAELFLGDLSKDPRLTTTGPLVAQMAEQARFRQDRYISGKFQDVADVRVEGLVGARRMQAQVTQGFDNMASRMGGIFGDSNGAIVSSANPNPGRATHLGDAIREDQGTYEVNDERILPRYSVDVVSNLSNMIGAQWNVQPDAKLGVSSVSKIYRNKQEADQAVNAVFRTGEQDTRFEREQVALKKAAAVDSGDAIKAAVMNAQIAGVRLNKDSFAGKVRATMLPPPVQNFAENFTVTHKRPKEHMQDKSLTYKYHTNQPRVESLVESVKSARPSVQAQAAPTTIPVKDRLAIAYQLNRTHKQGVRNEDAVAVQTNSTGALSKNAARVETLHEKLKQKSVDSVVYANQAPNASIDHVSNVAMSKRKFGDANKENATNNPTASTILAGTVDVSGFKYDTDPTMNNYSVTLHGGGAPSVTRITQLPDSDNNISPLSDIKTMYKTRYN